MAVCLTATMVAGLVAGCGGSEEEKNTGEADGKVTAKVIEVDLTKEEYAFVWINPAGTFGADKCIYSED